MKIHNKYKFSGKSLATSSGRSLNKLGLQSAVFAASLLITTFLFLPNLSSFGNLLTGNSTVNAAVESIDTFAANCTTPQSTWTLGGTVCAKGSGLPLGGERRFIWVAPDGTVPQVATVNADPDTDSYTLPLTGHFAQTGRWIVKIVDRRGAGRVSATFDVRSPGANADLSVTKSGPSQVTAGGTVTYTVTVTNNGPDAALNVKLDDLVPNFTTFVSNAQVSGPPFSCANTTVDEITTTSCTISSLAANATASFTFVYHVDSSAGSSTIIFNEATVSSSTNELNQFDNSAAVVTTISNAATCVPNCPSDVTQNSDSGQCGATVNYPAPSGSSCGSISCSPPSGAFFPLGATTVICTGDTGDPCRFIVTINDTGAHNLVCPANITATENPAGSGLATVNYTTPTTSACSGEVITCEPPSGSLFRLGTTTVTCTSSAGPACNFTVTVNQFDGCIINCPANLTISNNPGQCSATLTYTTPTTSGPCGPVTCTPPSGTSLPIGSATITCTDSTGTTCTTAVMVLDTEEPAINCPANITRPVDAGQCSTTVTYTTPTVSDNCSGVGAVTCTPPSGSSFPSGVTEVSCTATDAAGNTGACSFSVTVTETQPPTITCPSNITLPASPDCVAVEYSLPTATDNCPDVAVICVPGPGECFDPGVTTVTCIATDRAGNTATCSFTVQIGSCTLTCPANITVSNAANQCGAAVTYAAPSGTGCGTVTCSPVSGSFFPKGTTTVNCSASGSTCSFTVTVNDTQPPTINCPANIVVGNTPGQCSAAVTYAVTASDNCPGSGTPVCSPASGSVFPLGVTTVSCSVADAAGNTSTCSFTVRVNDTQAPVINVQTQPLALWPPNHKYRTVNVTELVISASDGCDPSVNINSVVIEKVTSDEPGPANNDIVIAANCKSVNLRRERDGGGDGRVYTITFRVRDAAGNTTTATAKVTIPHSNNGNPAVDSGISYTVTSSCP
jgi:uncharacterized repeat protein (TIGR01451 family)